MSRLIALCVVPEWELEPLCSLGVVFVSGGFSALSLSIFRLFACSDKLGIKPQNLPKDFAFLSVEGFQIDPEIESKIPLSLVVVDGKVRIRVLRKDIGHKVCIRLHENTLNCKARSVGFIHCNLSDTMDTFRKTMMHELLHLPEASQLKTGVFMECHMWPVTTEQESDMYVSEAITAAREVNVVVSTPQVQHARSVQTDRSSSWKPAADPLDPVQHSNRNLTRRGHHHHQTFADVLHSLHPRPTDQTGSDTSQPVFEEAGEEVDTGLLSSEPPPPSPPPHQACDVVISYVRVEAFQFASELKEELARLGFSVFLDADGIPLGSDWQDVLNGAISSCSLFVALVTPRYGETMWTNREVKLADILGKKIVPVNFTSSWPPLCLAIQFSTTQFIPWKRGAGEPDSRAMRWVASEIHSRHGRGVTHHSTAGAKVGAGRDPLLPSGSEEVDGAALEDAGVKKPSLRSCPTSLPKQTNPELVKLLRQPRGDCHLVVVISHLEQQALRDDTTVHLKSMNWDVYTPSVEVTACKMRIAEFSQKVDEAGCVIVLLSDELVASSSCLQQLYYCEQRATIVPVLVGQVKVPIWVSSLIGTNEFVQAVASDYKDCLCDFVSKALVPQAETSKNGSLPFAKDQHYSLLRQELIEKLPKEGRFVYVAGGTKFYSASGEAICREIGVQLAQHRDVVLVTGGFFGVGDTVARSFYDERQRLSLPPNVYHVQAVQDTKDKSAQTRQSKDGTFMKVPYGETVFVGNSVRERETLIPKVLRTCVLVEGGPGAAYEAEQFTWNGGVVVPLRVTGGAAAGGFGIPKTVLSCPSGVQQSDWALLGEDSASFGQVATAAAAIAVAVTDDFSKRRQASCSSCT